MLQGQEQDRIHQHPATASGAASKPDAPAGPVALHVFGDPMAFGGLVRALEGQGLQRAEALDGIENGLRQDADTRAVIVYPNPVILLAGQLQAGKRMGDAIAAWRDTTERLLVLFRRDRRRITLIDGHAAQRAPDLLQRLLGERLSRPLKVAEEGGAPGDAAEPAGLPQLVAAEALRQEEAAAALVAELEASSLPLGPAYRINVDAIAADGLTSADTAELDELRKENELLQLQLQQTQAELQALILENRIMKNERKSSSSEVEQARTEAGKARLARESLQAEFNEAREAWTAERTALTDKLKWTADDLAAVRRSLSWRLTAPIRRVLGLFVGDSKL